MDVSGTLCSVPEPGEYGSVRFAVCLYQWHLTDANGPIPANLPQRLRLTWYGDEATLEVPSRLRLTVRLKRPHGAVNPTGFRYESWLYRQGFGATGTIRHLVAREDVPCDLACHFHQWRAGLVRKASAGLEGMEAGPLILSLMLGYRGELGPDHWSTLKATGTIHLVAISGLHLGLIALGAGYVVRRVLVWLPERWLSPAAHRKLLFVAVCLASLVYALVAGFTVPTRRALIMVWFVAWWLLTSKRGQAWDSVLFAAALVLLLDPFSPLDQGFWLSFSAVFVLIFVFSARLRPLGFLPGLLLAQIAVFAGLWPILAAFDQSQPLTGLVANFIAIPVVSFVVMPLIALIAVFLVWAPELWSLIKAGVDGLLSAVWDGLVWMSQTSVPELTANGLELVGLALVVVIAIVVPMIQVRRLASFIVCVWALSVFVLPERDSSNNSVVEHPELWLWDVGQGLAAMIRFEDHVVVYDTGPELEGVYSSVESVLIPNMRALGVQRIDLLVISHGDNDHSGGLRQLADAFEIDQFVSGEPDRLRERLPQGLSGILRPCRDPITFEPRRVFRWQSDHPVQGNDASCVIQLVLDNKYEILLPGDITDSVESEFVSEALQAESGEGRRRILVAPHHGSKTSSSDVFLQAFDPGLVLFSAGYQHRYGHPHRDVVARYRELGTNLFNTARSGAIKVVLHPEGMRLSESRAMSPFWIRNPETVR